MHLVVTNGKSYLPEIGIEVHDFEEQVPGVIGALEVEKGVRHIGCVDVGDV